MSKKMLTGVYVVSSIGFINNGNRKKSMYIDIHNPHREDVDVLRNQNGAFATVRYSCDSGGELTMYFNNPDGLRSEAAALMLLAEALEEEQSK